MTIPHQAEAAFCEAVASWPETGEIITFASESQCVAPRPPGARAFQGAWPPRATTGIPSGELGHTCRGMYKCVGTVWRMSPWEPIE